MIIDEIAQTIYNAYQNKNKIILAGNGGSAAQASHFAAELIARYQRPRQPLPAMTITDPAIITAISNDFGYEYVFSRQIESLAQPNDIVILLTTSGQSANIINAAKAAAINQAFIIAFIGTRFTNLSRLANISVYADIDNTARIQEFHLRAIHDICHSLDRLM